MNMFFMVAASTATLFTANVVFEPSYMASSESSSSADNREQMRTVGSFTRITNKGPLDVKVEISKERSVTVYAPSKYMDKIETTTSGDELEISFDHKGSWYSSEHIKVVVTVPSIEAMSLYGSGDISVDGVKEDTFTIVLKGSGDVDLEDAAIGTLKATLQGSGDIKMDGTCKSADIVLRGSGDITAKAMKCKDVEALLNGSGDIDIFASYSADISLNGSGDIDLYGGPEKLKSKVNGSGDITTH